MVDVRGDVLRPPHGTTPAAVKTNKDQMSSFKSNENIHKKELYNKDYFCINLYLKSGVHYTDMFCLLVAQRILYGSVKHQFMVTNIILIVQIRQK